MLLIMCLGDKHIVYIVMHSTRSAEDTVSSSLLYIKE